MSLTLECGSNVWAQIKGNLSGEICSYFFADVYILSYNRLIGDVSLFKSSPRWDIARLFPLFHVKDSYRLNYMAVNLSVL